MTLSIDVSKITDYYWLVKFISIDPCMWYWCIVEKNNFFTKKEVKNLWINLEENEKIDYKQIFNEESKILKNPDLNIDMYSFSELIENEWIKLKDIEKIKVKFVDLELPFEDKLYWIKFYEWDNLLENVILFKE